jgi:cytosine/adenosine deaminase-related metal-dependent hydrolase
LLAALLLQATAFVGVNVVTMDGPPRLGQTVIVRDAHVEAISAVADIEVPADAQIVYGRGRWLVPGLVDMHVHIREVDLPAYVANGITTVRDLAGLDSVLDVMQRVDEGSLVGPRILASSLLLTGPNPQNPQFSRVIAVGARADLVLVQENPLENLATLRNPAGVLLNGRWISYDRRRAVRK